jgi:hypothetical protein
MSYQKVTGNYTVSFNWIVPAGIDLNDTETYNYSDKWGVLYIYNKKTDETIEVEKDSEETCYKYARDIDFHECDSDGNEI